MWLVVYENDLSSFVNEMLIKNLLLLIIQIVLMLVLVFFLLRKAVKPIKKLSEIITVLKNNSNTVAVDEELDEISEELVRVSNQLKLKLYYSQKEEQEYARMYVKQSDLLLEQKNYLANVVHDVKGNFSAIHFSSKSLENIRALSPEEKIVIEGIEMTSKNALTFITDSLNNVIDNSYDIYIKKDEVNIKQMITEYFEFNNMILLEKSLQINIEGEDKIITVNVLKFYSVINNILSNMLKYATRNTKLNIKISNHTCTFENQYREINTLYSGSYGFVAIEEATKKLNMKYKHAIKNGNAKFILYFEGDKDD